MPSGLTSNAAIRVGAVFANRQLQSWLKEGEGTQVSYSGRIAISDPELLQGTGSHEMRGGKIYVTVTRAKNRPDGVAVSRQINGVQVDGLEMGDWSPSSSEKAFKLGENGGFGGYRSGAGPANWVPVCGGAWKNTLVLGDKDLSFHYTIAYQPNHSKIKTPAGTFLCDRITVRQTDTLRLNSTSGIVSKPGAVTSVSYVPLEAEYYISDQVPGLMVKHTFTKRLCNLIFLLLHKNSHLNGGNKYPNAATSAVKPKASGSYTLQSLKR